MKASEVRRAAASAISTAAGLGLKADDAIVLNNSNKLALRLVPCDVLARVAYLGREVAEFEVDLAERLARIGAPVAALEPRVPPRVYRSDGFAVTLWAYYVPATSPSDFPAAYADALARLHSGMREVEGDVAVPHFTDRGGPEELVMDPDRTPTLGPADREFLSDTLRRTRRAIGDPGPTDQLLHGEPHPGNVLNTKDGLVFTDLETCSRGPVEFDLAYVPEAVSRLYPGADPDVLRDCRQLVFAIVAACRADPGDQFPNGLRHLRELLRALYEGPPWPALDDVMRRADGGQ